MVENDVHNSDWQDGYLAYPRRTNYPPAGTAREARYLRGWHTAATMAARTPDALDADPEE